MPRTPFACDFCCRRKTKCDNLHPACSNCVKAGLQCLDSSRSNKIGLSRSIVDYLEEHIAQLKDGLRESEFSQPHNEGFDLQTELGVSSTMDPVTNVVNGAASNSAASHSLAVYAACKSGTATGNLLVERGPFMLYDNALFTGSGLPLPLFQVHPFTQPEGELTYIEQSRQVPEMETLPVEVATLLFTVYVERILPHYPILSEVDAQDQFDAVYLKTNSEPSDSSVFITSMILAISTLTSKAHNVYRITSLSESLHRKALRRSHFLKLANIRSLQCLLLLAQYATYLPYTGNAWHIIGDAMRIAMELGLHREVSKYCHLNPAEIDLRRRLFWATYGMERSIAVTSHRPFSIKDEHICTSFPLDTGEIKPGTNTSTARCYRSKSQFLNYLRIRQLQSEICAIQFFHRDLHVSYKEWVMNVEERISEWEQSAWLENQGTGAPDWFSQVIWQCRLMVRRPCPKNPNPTEGSIVACFEAAIGTVRGSWELAQSGYLQCPFHNIHNGFEAGTIILYALIHYQESLLESYGDRKIMELVNQVSDILAAYSIRWPVASQLRELYDELKRSTMKSVMVPRDAVKDPHDLMVSDKIDSIVLCRPVETLYYDVLEGMMSVVPTVLLDPGSVQITTLNGNLSLPQNIQAPAAPASLADFWQGGSEIDFDFGGIEFHHTGSFGELVGDYDFASRVVLPSNPNIPLQQISRMRAKISETTESNHDQLCNAIEAIPACTRCRARRVKCNRNLPSCHNCQKSKLDCKYYDQVTSTNVSYQFISTLWQQANDLMVELRSRLAVGDSTSFVANSTNESPKLDHIHVTKSMFEGESPPDCHSETEVIRPNYINTMFFGEINTFANMAFISDPVTSQLLEAGPYMPFCRRIKRDLDLPLPGLERMPLEATARQLIDFFENSTNTFYPVFSRDDLEGICFDVYHTTGKVEPYKEQALLLIMAISLNHLGDTHPFILSTSRAYFQSATTVIDHISNVSTLHKFSTLQLALLYCLYVQKTPNSGDIWRLIGLACRVCLDLVNIPMNGGEKESFLRLYHTTYRLECDFATTLGRPPQLVETSIQLPITSSVQQACNSTDGLSMHMYMLARIQSRILDHFLTNNGSGKRSTNPLCPIDALQDCYERLEEWIIHWNRDLVTWKLSDPDPETLIPRGRLYGFMLWGRLLYQRSLLLLQRMSSKKLLTNAELHSHINNHIQCFKDLRNHQSALGIQYLSDPMALAPTIYPITWTLSQSVFAVALDILAAKAHDTSGISWDVTFRNCSILLASLEANENNLCEGLGQALEIFIAAT